MAEWMAYGVFDSLALRLPQPAPDRSAVLVCAQLLGDYELCKPYIRAFFKRWRNDNLRVVLVCNVAWQELAIDDLHPDDVIGIDVYRITHDLRYRVSMFRNLRELRACVAVCAAYPRDGLVHDACMKAVAASRSFCYRDEYSDRAAMDGWMARRHYTDIISCPIGAHRTQRHAILTTAAGIVPPSQPEPLPTGKVHPANPDAPYFVISPGASRHQKAWPINRFIAIAKLAMLEYPDLSCVLIGAPSEALWIDAMSAEIGERATSLAGLNSLKQLNACIRGAVAVLGNDSAAIHIAAACLVPSVVVMNGATYGHCVPYPPGRENPVFPIAPIMAVKPMPCFCCDWNCRFVVAEGESFPCLNAVTVEQVWEKLDAIFLKRPWLHISPRP